MSWGKRLLLGCDVGRMGNSLPSLTRLPSRNYGPTVAVQQEAQKKGCEQVLWLYGPDHQLTEVGTMNIFVYWTHEDGGEPTHVPTHTLYDILSDSFWAARSQNPGQVASKRKGRPFKGGKQ